MNNESWIGFNRHIQNVQGELRLHILAYAASLLQAHQHVGPQPPPSILPETRPQNGSNCTSRSAFFMSFGPPKQPIFLLRSNPLATALAYSTESRTSRHIGPWIHTSRSEKNQ